METQQLAGLIGQGGIAAALIYVIFRVGGAMVDAVKGLRQEIADHTKADLAAQAEVREDLAALNAKIDVLADVTPIRGVPKRAATEPGARGFYGPRRPARDEE